jgi:hypothetical protein
MVHSSNPSSWEIEAGGTFQARLGLHSETLSEKKNKINGWHGIPVLLFGNFSPTSFPLNEKDQRESPCNCGICQPTPL